MSGYENFPMLGETNNQFSMALSKPNCYLYYCIWGYERQISLL